MSIPPSAPLAAPSSQTVDTDTVAVLDATEVIPARDNATAIPTADAVVTLDPLRFPLQGSQLIEASAGTGKTFTIATLYLRLVLGHGIQGAPRAHTPPEILVVTFTEAATQELRDRIRARLTEAAAAFRADPASISPRPAGEDPLHDLRQDYEPGQWPGCAYRLQLAADWMDEAAVSTIHAWCHRMLREHAFDSGSLFTQTLETDQTELLAEVVRDYWRTFMVPLGREDVAEVRHWWADPDALRLALRGLVDHAEQLEDAPAPALALAAAREEMQRRLAALKAPWATWTEELQALLDGAVTSKSVNGKMLQSRYYNAWLNALRAWVTDPTAESLDLATGWKRLTPAGLDEAWKPERKPVPDHPALAATTELRAALGTLPDAEESILRHAARWVAARFAVEQARRAQMGFHDLLTRLDAALRGPNGGRLADTLRRQFPVALIDEFQDTDPVQYRIFDTVYRVASNDPATALILIGDPKQAIYAFRGADIYTYLQARQACAGRLHTLGTNYRSTHAMVRAANRCFTAAEARATGAGAFLFRGEGGNPVPFIAAEARGRSDTLHAAGKEIPALTAWWLPPRDDGKTLSKETYRDQIAEVCASEMVRLLNLGQAGQAGFVAGGGRAKSSGADDGSASESIVGAKFCADAGVTSSAGAVPIRPLRPADLAVLVNKRQEADLIRRALARRGVRSVYLSDQDSVYQSPQAGELRHWLAACAEPDDLRLVRTALATSTLGLSWAELDRLNQDDLALEERVLQFRGYRDLWRRQGVLPMLRGLLNDFHVPARLLGTDQVTRPAERRAMEPTDETTGPEAQPTAWQDDQATGPVARPPLGTTSGERVLTDLLHLAELLQRASLLLDGEHALIRYLAEQCQEAGGNGRDEARQIRLESDADLVQVVTVHKSKGLEYPLVFLPFAADFRPTTAKDLPLKWHDDRGELQLTLGDVAEAVRRADRERLGEDLRKLYVALTRARYATWVGLAPIAELERGAFGYLLSAGEPLPPTELAPALERLRGDSADLVLVPAPTPSTTRYRAAEAPGWTGRARDSRPVVTTPWWIASYSAISRTVSHGALGEFDAFATTEDEAGGAGREGGRVDGSGSPALFSRQVGAAGTATEERFLEMRALGTWAQGPETEAGARPNLGPIHAFP
ncbi:MAG TPA: UvrD-helicase domain-containing protein, partial [Chromatiaceae bacterium]|nr:UvrD-helicase domain-containing protein [Chromatiaceae bacterium]